MFRNLSNQPVYLRKSLIYLSFTCISALFIKYGLTVSFRKKNHAIHNEPPYVSPDEKYINNAKHQFLNTYNELGHCDKYNGTVEREFYWKEEYLLLMKEPGNCLEIAWKSRIMFECTPRGNIIMFYDAFKRGFAYYSDQTIPYSILNAAAMKYVVMYRCRDFFLDELVVPSAFPGPFIKMYEVEDIKVKINDGHKKIDTRRGAFAKLKTYSSALSTSEIVANSSNVSPPELVSGSNQNLTNSVKSKSWIDFFKFIRCTISSGINSTFYAYVPKSHKSSCALVSVKLPPRLPAKLPISIDPQKLVIKNRMINLGKMANFSILNKPNVVKCEAVPTVTMHYRDYKFWRSPDVETNGEFSVL